MKPFPYQADCLTKLAKARKKRRKKSLVVMATGLGKTVVSAFDIQRLLKEAPGRVLYLCHQNHILKQAREEFEEILRDSYSYGYFHGTEKHLHRVDVLFASFQTMVKSRELFDPREFKYIVVDESHHSHAATFLPTLKYFKPDYMLALTATPERGDGLDITEIFGKPVCEIDLFEALARRLLCDVDYRVMTDEIQNTSVLDTSVGKLSIAELNRTIFIPKRDEEIVRIIDEKTAEIKDPRVMIFCSSIEHAERMAALMRGALAVHSELTGKEQDRRLDAFRSGEVGTIITIDKANEGVNIPRANVVVFLRSTSSKTIFLQQLGRGLRKAKGKLKVLVLDFVANCERIEMIDELSQGVRRAFERLPSSLTGDKEQGASEHRLPLTLTVDGARFDERLVKLFDMVRGVRGGYTKEILAEQLLRKADELGRTPTRKDIDADMEMASLPTYMEVFGTTWNGVLSLVGLAPSKRFDYTREELASQLKKKAQELGRAPTAKEVDKDSAMASVNGFCSVFGTTWSGVLKAADLKGQRRSDYSKNELTEQLQRKAKELGRTPTAAEVKRDPSMASLNSFGKVFGTTWNGVLEAAGFTPVRRHGYTTEELTLLLRNRVETLGRVPTSLEVEKDPSLPSVASFTRAFNAKWSEILTKLGLG